MSRSGVIGIAVAAVMVSAFAAVSLRPFYRDLSTARSLAPLLAEARRLVPVRRDPDLRGDDGKDYWCFADGLCLYAIETFRRLYPAYNDLEDEALLHEIRERQGKP